MITISLCMIVRDEEDVLARCLESAAGVADETILVDTGSADATKEIARRYTDKVYDFPWIDDFSAARNFSFSRAEMEYCMWLDADDVLEADDRSALLDLKRTLDPATDVVMLRYQTAFDEDGKPTLSYYRERIVRNSPDFRWAGAVHEAITPAGIVRYADIAVSHRKPHPSDPARNLRIYEKQLAAQGELAPRDRFYYARELYYHARYPDAVREFEGFLDEGRGWIENNIEACRHLAWCRYALKQPREALTALLCSLEYDTPRAEVCCDIGRHFLDRARYREAIFWYELALTRDRDDRSGAFVCPDCYGYLPCIQLCVCYDRLGDRARAVEYNDRAGKYKPDDPSYLRNKLYFAAQGA